MRSWSWHGRGGTGTSRLSMVTGFMFKKSSAMLYCTQYTTQFVRSLWREEVLGFPD